MNLKKSSFLCVLLTLSVAVCSCDAKKPLPVKVFILGGQSNMDGCGKAAELPKAYKVHPGNTMTWDNKLKTWTALDTDSVSEKRGHKFGPEIAFSHAMAKKFPQSTIAVVKTSAGGTKLWKHWLPKQGMNKRFFLNMENALQQLRDDEMEYELCGMLWMQGESDSEEIDKAKAYEENLKIFFKEVRTRTGNADFPIVMGRISIGLLRETPWCFDHTKIVQQAQDHVAAADKNVFIINTDDLKTLKDNTHFNTEAQIWLGDKMGEIMGKELGE